jgi:nucleotide-binding universal stress UspA family protein
VPDQSVASRLARIVLGLGGSPTDELVVRLGCDLGLTHRSELVGIHVVEVDWRHSLGEELYASRDAAARVLDLAEAQAARSKVTMRSQLLQARDVGAALVDEAVELGADALILGLPYRKRFGGDFAMGRTVPYVLENAPCAVIVVREPVAAGTARGTTMRRG